MPLKITCPDCRKRLTLPPNPAPGSVFRCGACGKKLKIRKTPSTPPTPPPAPQPKAAPPPPPPASQVVLAELAPTQPRPTKPRRPTRPRPSLFSFLCPTVTSDVGWVSMKGTLILWFGGLALVVIVLLILTPLVDAKKSGDEEFQLAFLGSMCLGAVWLLCGWLPSRIFMRFLIDSRIKALACPRCGEQIPVWGIWGCQCGYHGHQHTNVIFHRCPKCDSPTSGINCPRCDTTILTEGL